MQQKFIKYHTMLLARLSFIYWLIHFKIYFRPLSYKDDGVNPFKGTLMQIWKSLYMF